MNNLQTDKEKLESYTKKTLHKFQDKYMVAISHCKAQIAEKNDKIDYLEVCCCWCFVLSVVDIVGVGDIVDDGVGGVGDIAVAGDGVVWYRCTYCCCCCRY